MPLDNTNPVGKSETSEFEFDVPQAGVPRLKKRNLKVRPSAETAAEASATRPTPSPDEPRPAVYAKPAAIVSSLAPRPAYARPSATTERPQPAPAAGVLYYTSQSGPKKEDSMKSTPLSQTARPATTASTPSSVQRPVGGTAQPVPQRTAGVGASPIYQRSPAPSTPQTTRPTGSASHPSSGSSPRPGGYSTPSSGYAGSSASRPVTGSSATPGSAGSGTAGSSSALSTTVAAPSSSRPAGVSDYRSNINRQSREQKSIGSILNFIVYGLIALFVLAGVLAIYGANDVYKRLHAQSLTVSELDSRYSAANQALSDQLKAQGQDLQQISTQLNRSQELLLRQQDALTKMQASLDAQTEALREERATRAAETSIRTQENAVLRSRLRILEAKVDATYRP